MFVAELKCVICGCNFKSDEVFYTCLDCGQVGTLDVTYDLDAIRAATSRDAIEKSTDPTLWRYKPLMPIAQDAPVPPLAVGGTPLYETPRLSEDLGLAKTWVKDDGRNPTGSLKDRASALIVARAMAEGIEVVTTASTGNAAAALAGLAASVGLPAVIFVPASAPEAKIAQLLIYGAKVMLVQGNYDTAFDLAVEASERYGWYNRNTGMNPYTLEGKKTVAYEIAEQLNWQMPDVVAVSVGDGNIISGVHKGFRDLFELGWIDKMPRLLGVQAAGSAACYQVWKMGKNPVTMEPINAQTVADSIAADLPRDRVKAVRAVKETNGAFVSVPDDAILHGIPVLAQLTGVFAEPAAASVYAGVRAAISEGHIQPDESVVLLVTGNGLKDIKSAMQVAGEANSVAPGIEEVEKVRQALGLPSFV